MDLYLLLGVARAASADEIRRAYRRLARRYHPDINPGDRVAEEQFQRISSAFETLIDPERRQRYDAEGRVSDPAPRSVVGFEGFDFSVSVRGASASTFGDLFSEILQGTSREQEPERGADLRIEMAISLEDAFTGGERDLEVVRYLACDSCAGSGRVRVAERPCPQCNGSGSLRSVRGHMVFSRNCGTCGGSGRLSLAACGACHGRQLQMRVDSVRVQLPAGVADGDRLVVPGGGHGGRHGGAAGDLHVTVHVAPHPRFRRDGDDLHVLLPIAIHEAGLGAKIDVPTIAGPPARLRIPPGTQSGQRFRLRARGMMSGRADVPGDLVVEVRLMLPPLLDERSKELLREFARINSTDVRVAAAD